MSKKSQLDLFVDINGSYGLRFMHRPMLRRVSLKILLCFFIQKLMFYLSTQIRILKFAVLLMHEWW